jgi:hypothetical protein
MAQPLDVIDLIIGAVPTLRVWGEQHRDTKVSISELCTHLVAELRDHIRNGEIPELQALAPTLEVLLDAYDDHDEVSLGLIEPLVWSALDGKLDSDRTRAVLGATAQLQWDGLYLWARMQDLRPIEFGERDLGPTARAPAFLVEWAGRSGRWVPAQTLLARLTIAEQPADLRVTARCWVDRFASPAGFPLEVGALLLYVAPEALGIPKNTRLCSLDVHASSSQPAA